MNALMCHNYLLPLSYYKNKQTNPGMIMRNDYIQLLCSDMIYMINCRLFTYTVKEERPGFHLTAVLI